MKDNTKRHLAALTAAIMTTWFGFNGIIELGNGNVGHGFFGIVYGIGMLAALIALYKQPTEGKLYNTAIILGGLPSLGFAGLAIWSIVDGTFRPANLFQLIVGVVGVLVIAKIIARVEEGEPVLEANE